MSGKKSLSRSPMGASGASHRSRLLPGRVCRCGEEDPEQLLWLFAERDTPSGPLWVGWWECRDCRQQTFKL